MVEVPYRYNYAPKILQNSSFVFILEYLECRKFLLLGFFRLVENSCHFGAQNDTSPEIDLWNTLHEANSLHLKMDGWKTRLSFWTRPIFRGHASFREGNSKYGPNVVVQKIGSPILSWISVTQVYTIEFKWDDPL